MPFERSTADLTTGNVKGLTGLPHLRDLGVDGPYDVTGVRETPSRRKIFVCRAKEILSVLARRAFRRPVTEASWIRAMKSSLFTTDNSQMVPRAVSVE